MVRLANEATKKTQACSCASDRMPGSSTPSEIRRNVNPTSRAKTPLKSRTATTICSNATYDPTNLFRLNQNIAP
jgi:hypothetical protein